MSRILRTTAGRFVSTEVKSGTISGTVKIDASPDIPVVRRVCLFRKDNGILFLTAVSAADGSYSFTSVPDGEYFLVSFDHTRDFNATILDGIRPLVAP